MNKVIFVNESHKLESSLELKTKNKMMLFGATAELINRQLKDCKKVVWQWCDKHSG